MTSNKTFYYNNKKKNEQRSNDAQLTGDVFTTPFDNARTYISRFFSFKKLHKIPQSTSKLDEKNYVQTPLI